MIDCFFHFIPFLHLLFFHYYFSHLLLFFSHMKTFLKLNYNEKKKKKPCRTRVISQFIESQKPLGIFLWTKHFSSSMLYSKSHFQDIWAPSLIHTPLISSYLPHGFTVPAFIFLSASQTPQKCKNKSIMGQNSSKEHKNSLQIQVV